MAAEESQGALFDDCFVSLVESKELPLEHIREVSSLVVDTGLQKLTMCSFPQLSRAMALLLLN